MKTLDENDKKQLMTDMLITKGYVDIETVNTIMKNLGYNELQFVSSPMFFWNGNCVTNDETAQIKQVGTLSLKDQSFKDMLEKNKDKKIVIYKLNKDEVRLAIL